MTKTISQDEDEKITAEDKGGYWLIREYDSFKIRWEDKWAERCHYVVDKDLVNKLYGLQQESKDE